MNRAWAVTAAVLSLIAGGLVLPWIRVRGAAVRIPASPTNAISMAFGHDDPNIANASDHAELKLYRINTQRRVSST